MLRSEPPAEGFMLENGGKHRDAYLVDMNAHRVGRVAVIGIAYLLKCQPHPVNTLKETPR